MRGFFGIGVEGASKALNVGNLFRSAHAFGASFAFTVAPNYRRDITGISDTSDASRHMPFYSFPSVEALRLPDKCELVGVELLDEAIELPSFRHPLRAAYVLGRERGSLTPPLLERCNHVIRIPTRFCINVAVAGAVVMYDRLLAMGRFAERPLMAGAAPAPLPEHRHGGPRFRKAAQALEPFLAEPPPAVETNARPRKRGGQTDD